MGYAHTMPRLHANSSSNPQQRGICGYMAPINRKRRRHSVPESLPTVENQSTMRGACSSRRRRPSRGVRGASPKLTIATRSEASQGLSAAPSRPSSASSSLLPDKVQIPRKLFKVVHEVFKEYDCDGDGLVTRDEFILAASRCSQERSLVGVKRPSASVAFTAHAAAMFEAATRRLPAAERDALDLASFVAMYFPHLPKSAVARACHRYTYKPPPVVPPPKTLDDCDGAKDEIAAIFDNLDGDHDGLVRVRSLEPLLQRIGISQRDVQGWLQELESPHAGTLQLHRLKSKLDVGDLEKLLAPVYVEAEHPVEERRDLTMEEMQRRLQWNQELVAAFSTSQ